MAASYAEWKREVSKLDTLISQIGASVLLIRKLEGVTELESKLLLNPPRNGEVAAELEDFIDGISIKHFGISRDDTLFKYPANFGNLSEGTPAWFSVESRAVEHEERFSTELMTDDEVIPLLLVMGVDFRDDRGDPLRCTKLLCRQVEAAALKIMGHLPDVDSLGLKTWESKLEKEAQLHLARKGKSR